MCSLLDNAKAYETLARITSDPKKVKKYLDRAKRLKNLNEMMKKSTVNDRKFAH